MQLEELLAQIDSAKNHAQEPRLLAELWRAQPLLGPAWTASPEPYQRIGRRLLKLGYPAPAGEIATAALEFTRTGRDESEDRPWETDAELRRIRGLALARTGNAAEANQIALQLVEEGHTDEETLGLLGRAYKDLALAAANETTRRRYLELSLAAYTRAHSKPEHYWTGINVATLETVMDNTDHASEVAASVRTHCETELERLEQNGKDCYWALATLGEAALNLHDWAEAEKRYREAYNAAPNKYGDLLTTRRQARWLVTKLGRDANLVNEWLPIPKVVVFAGHMVDRPGRSPERFPPRLADAVQQAIRAWLKREHALIGFSSAACGSDLLFQQALRELGGETNLVLPFAAEDFVKESVTFTGQGDWQQRFDDALEHATRTVIASDQKTESGSVSYDYANLVLHGLAAVRARELGTGLVALAVWDGKAGDGPGGTADAVARWRKLQVPVYRVDLSDLPAWESGTPPVLREPAAHRREQVDLSCSIEKTCVMALLFADVVNFSKLREEQVPRFVEHYLGAVAKQLKPKYLPVNPVRNTWGDGLYLVFNSVESAGNFALELRNLVRNTKWVDYGLPADMNVRVALHVGPVYYCVDPVIEQPNYTGTHVSRAARLEPKTAAGEVYASEAFAALAAVAGVTDFTCEYVKQLAWDKRHGTFPTYVVRRQSE